MILFSKSYEDTTVKSHIIYNKEDKSLDTIPRLNSDIQLLVSYINIGFDSETMIANQVWGFSPEECWIVNETESPKNSEKAVLKLSTELEPGAWRLDREMQWKTYYNFKTEWLCIGNPNVLIGDECIAFLENAISVLNSAGELKSLWIHCN